VKLACADLYAAVNQTPTIATASVVVILQPVVGVNAQIADMSVLYCNGVRVN
jgi:hypothetical protein